MLEPVMPIVGEAPTHEPLHGGSFHRPQDDGASEPAALGHRASGEVVWVAGALDAPDGPRFAICEHGEWLLVLVPESLSGRAPAQGVHVGDFWEVAGGLVHWGDRRALLATALLPVAIAPPPGEMGIGFDQFA